MEGIAEKEIHAQSWKFYFILLAWPLYLLILPWVYSQFSWWAILFMVFPGVFLFTWLGYLMHETWHRYVHGLPNNLLYNLLSWMLLSDPQNYRLIHGYHHSLVNTWKDTEFHPLGRIENIWLRRIYNTLEIIFGIVFVELFIIAKLPGHPSYKDKYKIFSVISTLIMIFIIYFGIGVLAHFIFHLSPGQLLAIYLVNLWIDSFVLHMSQIVEHGNLIVEGDYNTRNLKTRNLSNKGIASRIFLFFTHWDSQEHVLHHTHPAIYTRAFPGRIKMPPGSVEITFYDFMLIIKNMALGREQSNYE